MKEIICECGEVIETNSWNRVNNFGDFKCEKCGNLYNSGGQKLAPVSQWGEETGERFSGDGYYVGGGETEDY